jgi:hypothetical protein
LGHAEFPAQLSNRHPAFSLAQDRKDLWFAKSRRLHQLLLRHLVEKILRPHSHDLGGITRGIGFNAMGVGNAGGHIVVHAQGALIQVLGLAE